MRTLEACLLFFGENKSSVKLMFLPEPFLVVSKVTFVDSCSFENDRFNCDINDGKIILTG
jgi:hypothetical protein